MEYCLKKIYLLLLFIFNYHIIFAQSSAGPDRAICKGSTVTIGTLSEDPKFCFSWSASPSDPNLKNPSTAKINVSPSQTTTYILTVIGQDFSSKTTSQVIVTVVENNAFTSTNVTIKGGATPKIPLASQGRYVYGFTDDESIDIEISACSDGKNWHPIIVSVNGNYSEEIRLLPGPPQMLEVTGPNGNTTQVNFCNQVSELKSLGGINWYMLSAVKAHEDVHATRLKPALENVANKIEQLIEGVSLADNGQTQQDAILQIKALQDYKTALIQSVQLWDADYIIKISNDHNPGGAAEVAEHNIVDPMIASICNFAKIQTWGLCASCPP